MAEAGEAMTGEWVTVADAAILGKCSRATVYRILADPRVKVRTVTGADRVQRLNAHDFLKAQGTRVPGRPKGTPSHNRRTEPEDS